MPAPVDPILIMQHLMRAIEASAPRFVYTVYNCGTAGDSAYSRRQRASFARDVSLCFEMSPLDVRDAWFDVSQDGRLVVTTCGHPFRPGSRNLVVAGLDRCHEQHVKHSHNCAYPVWRPRRTGRPPPSGVTPTF